jgi:hypothetical protein
MSLEVNHHHLPTVPEGDQFPLAKDQRIWEPSDIYMLIAEVVKTLGELCERVASTL